MKPIDFKGQTAVITGAASGMGLCASRELAKLGASVFMCDINRETVERHAAEIAETGGTAFPCVVDVRNHADAEKVAALALEKTGRIDLLVCFAGGWEPRMCNSFHPFYEQPYDVLDWGIDVNLKGPIYFARASKTAGLAYMQEPGHWREDRDYLRCVSDFRRRYREILQRGTFRADEGFAVAGGEKLIANRWTGTNGEEGVLVWNAAEASAAVRVGFAKTLIGCAEPERGDVAADEPLAANTLRLYRFK